MDVVAIDLLCRCCLNETKHSTSLYDTYVDDEFVLDPEITNSEAIFMCTNIQYDESDSGNGNELPKTICDECMIELRVAVNFRAKCEASDHLLRQQRPKITESNQSLFENFCVEEIVEHEQIEDETGLTNADDATENYEFVCSNWSIWPQSLHILKFQIDYYRKRIWSTTMHRRGGNLSFQNVCHQLYLWPQRLPK